ncbi:MAG TPA: hypothetical protein VIN07_10375 [Flavipsychrobacter sp.]
MKQKLSLIVIAAFVVYACNKKSATVDTNLNRPGKTPDFRSYALMGLDSPFLSPDTANVMIKSYLGSITNEPNQLKSLIVDANALRYYLQNTNITSVKLMFAHKKSYIQNGTVLPDMDYRALTIVIAGFDSNNNYIYSPQGAVMDFCQPCPANCPPSGTAASDLLNN